MAAAVGFGFGKRKRPEAEKEDAAAKAAGGVDYSIQLDLTVPTGQVAMVIGSVGCGKSSVLQAVLGEMQQVAGHPVQFQGPRARVSYCAQQPWLMNATLKENILFVR